MMLTWEAFAATNVLPHVLGLIILYSPLRSARIYIYDQGILATNDFLTWLLHAGCLVVQTIG